jgi:hypothetical protein
MPEVLALRAERLLPGHQTTTSAVAVPIDFEREDLGEALRQRGYASGSRTLFLWEGVTYYLPVEAVRAVLSFVASQSEPGSSILFDYVTKAFVDGDYSGLAPVGWLMAGDGSATSTDVALTISLRSLFPSGSGFGPTSPRVNSSAVISRCGLALVSEHVAACASPMPYDHDRTGQRTILQRPRSNMRCSPAAAER